MPQTPRVNVRTAEPQDAGLILRLILELAEYERLRHAVVVTEQTLRDSLFPTGAVRPAAGALIGEVDGQPQGYAVYFFNFSTFLGRAGIYLEDVYVRPAVRGLGLGKALLSRVAAIGVERGCQRMEWAVLDWNQPAIDFYKSLGAEILGDWRLLRLTGEALRTLATPA